MENKVELILEELAFHLETLISFWLLVLRSSEYQMAKEKTDLGLIILT